MSIKRKVLAVAATMTMMGGVSAASLLPADASTGPCPTCATNLWGEEYPGSFVLDDWRQGENVGQPIILYRASNTDPAEDFTILDQGYVYTYYADGMVSSVVNLDYGNYEAYEVEYSPYGVNSGLCIGIASTAANDTPVALEKCGASSKTVWVTDSGVPNLEYYAWINGSDTNSSNPYVLHYPIYAYPTDTPRAQLTTYGLQQYSNGEVYDNEEWAGLNAVAPPPPT